MQQLSTLQLQALISLAADTSPELHALMNQCKFSYQDVTIGIEHYTVKFKPWLDVAPLNSAASHMMINFELRSANSPTTVVVALYVINRFINTLDLFVGEGGMLPCLDSFFLNDRIAPWVEHRITIL